MLFRKSTIQRKLDDIDDRCSRAHQRDSDFRYGYLRGFYAAMQYERETQAWIRSGGKGPMPVYNPEPPRTEFKRLQRHLEREHRRLAKELW